MWKAACRRASGRISRGRIATPRKSKPNGYNSWIGRCDARALQAGSGGYEDEYAGGGQGGAPSPRREAPRNQGAQAQQRQAPNRQSQDEDLGPAFPSEASNMDEVPF